MKKTIIELEKALFAIDLQIAILMTYSRNMSWSEFSTQVSNLNNISANLSEMISKLKKELK